MALSRWTPERVLDAAAAWVWIPEGAIEVHADDYLLIRYPDRFLDPGFPAAQVVWLKTARPLDGVIDEVAAQVRAWGLDKVDWWISAATIPAEAESDLRAHTRPGENVLCHRPRGHRARGRADRGPVAAVSATAARAPGRSNGVTTGRGGGLGHRLDCRRRAEHNFR